MIRVFWDCVFRVVHRPRGWFDVNPMWCYVFTENLRLLANVDLMLGHRLRRWPNIKSTLGQSLVFPGLCFYVVCMRKSL